MKRACMDYQRRNLTNSTLKAIVIYLKRNEHFRMLFTNTINAKLKESIHFQKKKRSHQRSF